MSIAGKRNITVVLRSRPIIKREKDARQTKQWHIEGNTIESTNLLLPNSRYTFDQIYGDNSTNQELYIKEVQPIVEQVVKGYHGTVFAYGQTSSGKTFTMLGDKKNPGVIRLAARQIFAEISKAEVGCSFVIRINYLEIYNEKLYDLLNNRNELKIKEMPNGDLNVGEGQLVSSEDEILKLVDAGNVHRKVAETNMNVQSSRSHAILQISIQSAVSDDDPALVSVLNLVDLAGSERAEQTGARNDRLKEAGNINKSLLTLSIVINKLSEDPDGHICYRDSKLTRMLQNSLGGNSMTVMICAITPVAVEETNNTLGFATRAKKIENKPVVNEVVSDAVEVKRMKKKIVHLEEKLETQKKQIEDYEKMQKELFTLKHFTIQSSPHTTVLPAAQRRKTWGGDLPGMQPKKSLSELAETKASLLGNVPVNVESNGTNEKVRQIDQRMLSERGCGSYEYDADEFNESEWQNGSNFKMPSIDEDEETKTPVSKTAKKAPARKSLLQTPKSIKFKWNRVNDETPTSSAASPIALDKNKRIEALENELEELRHFKAMETTTLKDELEASRKKIIDMEAQLETAQRELKDSIRERSSAVQAKVLAEQAKTLAEQNMTSIEYEYEQHKARASRREKELVEQLENLGNDESMKLLKEKVSALTAHVNSLETQLWQNEKKHKDELDAVHANVIAEQKKSMSFVNQIDKLKGLQNDYDEVSGQLVDSIQENDRLKSRCDALNATIADLNKKISNLEAQSTNQQTTDQTFQDLQAKLDIQCLVHASDMQQVKENHQLEMKNMKQLYDDAMDDVHLLLNSVNESEIQLSEAKEKYNKLVEEYNGLYDDWRDLQTQISTMGNIKTQLVVIFDCLKKDYEILRNAFGELKMNSAEQELVNYKLQKTINELDETMSGSVLNETASVSIANITQQNNEPSNELTIQLDKLNQERDTHVSQLESIRSRLLEVVKIEDTTAHTDINELLDKLFGIQNEFNSIKELLGTYQSSDSTLTDASSIVDIIRSNFDRSAAIEHENVSLADELKMLKVKFDELHSAKQENEVLITTLQNNIQALTERVEMLQYDEKRLREDLENEKLNNGQLLTANDEFQKKITIQEEREKQLNDQTQELSEIKSKQRIEITRLQQMVTENTGLSLDLSKLNKEIDDLNAKLGNALAEVESLKASLDQKEQDLVEKVQQISELNSKIESNEVEMVALHQQIKEIKEVQEKNAMHKESIEGSVIAKDSQIESLTAEIASLKKSLARSIQSKEQLTELTEELAQKKDQLKNAAAEIAKLKIIVSDLEHLNVSNQTDFDKLKNEYIEQLTQKENELKTASLKIVELTATAESNEQQRLLDQENNEKLQQEIVAKQTQREQELKVATSKITELTETIENERRLKESNQKNVDKLRNEVIEKLEQKEQKLNAATSQITELEAKVRNNDGIQANIEKKFAEEQRQIQKTLAEKEKLLKEATSEMIELKEIVSNYERLKKENQKSLDEFKQQIMVLEAEQERLEASNRKLEFKVKSQLDEMNVVQKELAETKHAAKQNDAERKQLADKINNKFGSLAGACSSNLQSPKLERSTDVERLRDENRTLKSQHQLLEREVEELRKSASHGRKKKRQSIHDDTRRISGYDGTMIDMETQTDPVDEKCGCIEMNKQIIKLRQDKIILEARYATFRDSTGVDHLIAEVKTLKTDLSSTKYKLSKISNDYDNLTDKYEELKIKSAIAQQKPSTTDAAAQTDGPKTGATFVEQMDWERVNRRAENYKKHYQEVVTSYNELKAKYTKLVDDVGTSISDTSSAAYNELKTKYVQLKTEFEEHLAKSREVTKTTEEMQQKYNQTKRICNSRLDEINELKRKIAEYEANEKMLKSELSSINRIKENYEKLQSEIGKSSTKSNDTDAYNELKVKYEQSLAKCRETAEFLDEIKIKYNKIKDVCNARFKKLEEYEQKITVFEQTENNLKSELEKIKEELLAAKAEVERMEIYRRKYEKAKIMYQEMQNSLNEDLDKYKGKYDTAKVLLESRRQVIEKLEEQLNEKAENNENVPLNK